MSTSYPPSGQCPPGYVLAYDNSGFPYCKNTGTGQTLPATVQNPTPFDYSNNPYWIMDNGNPLSIHFEDHFYKEDHLAFSPATQSMSPENLFLVIALIQLGKTPEGQKIIRDIAIKYLDSCARIVESVESACHSNWLTALNNQHITATIAHRIGLIDDGGYEKIVDHYRNVFDKMYNFGAIEGLSTLILGGESKSFVGEEKTGGVSDLIGKATEAIIHKAIAP